MSMARGRTPTIAPKAVRASSDSASWRWRSRLRYSAPWAVASASSSRGVRPPGSSPGGTASHPQSVEELTDLPPGHGDLAAVGEQQHRGSAQVGTHLDGAAKVHQVGPMHAVKAVGAPPALELGERPALDVATLVADEANVVPARLHVEDRSAG